MRFWHWTGRKNANLEFGTWKTRVWKTGADYRKCCGHNDIELPVPGRNLGLFNMMIENVVNMLCTGPGAHQTAYYPATLKWTMSTALYMGQVTKRTLSESVGLGTQAAAWPWVVHLSQFIVSQVVDTFWWASTLRNTVCIQELPESCRCFCRRLASCKGAERKEQVGHDVPQTDDEDSWNEEPYFIFP